MSLAKATLILIEGLRLRSYLDSGKVWTIGVGHTKGVQAEQVATLEQVMQWLDEDQATLLGLVKEFDPIAQAAYISFGFNCGAAKLRRVIAGEDDISNPVHTTDRKGNIQPGLVARRNFELELLKLAKHEP